MKIYLLQQESVKGLSSAEEIEIIDQTSLRFSDTNEFRLEHDKQTAMRSRGYPLTEMELTTYYRHYAAWKDLADSEESEYALIVENVDAMNLNGEELQELVSSLELGWNVYFPFDAYERKVERNGDCMLGFRWGTDAYFINRCCLSLLLSHKKIGRPIDEQLLFFNQKDQLDIYYEELDVFSFGDSVKYKIDNERFKLDYVLSANVWSEQDLKLARLLLADVCALLYDNAIDFFISEGTLLGYVRHGQIMPWDDDIDMSISACDIPQLLDIINGHDNLKVIKRYWGKNKVEYYKIWYSDSKNIEGYPYGFPFIDIWCFDRLEEYIIYNFGSKFPIEAVYPTQKANFERTEVNIPKDSLKYLDMKYKDWRERIVVYPWSHKLEKRNTFPLSLQIEVDERGVIYKS